MALELRTRSRFLDIVIPLFFILPSLFLIWFAFQFEGLRDRLFLQFAGFVVIIVVTGVVLTTTQALVIVGNDLLVKSRIATKKYPLKNITELLKFYQLKMYTDGPATGLALLLSTNKIHRKQIFALQPKNRAEFEEFTNFIGELKKRNKRIRARSQIQRGFEIVKGTVYWLNNGKPGKKADFGPIKDEYEWFFGRNLF